MFFLFVILALLLYTLCVHEEKHIINFIFKYFVPLLSLFVNQPIHVCNFFFWQLLLLLLQDYGY